MSLDHCPSFILRGQYPAVIPSISRPSHCWLTMTDATSYMLCAENPYDLPASLDFLLTDEAKSLKWIFVGGKGEPASLPSGPSLRPGPTWTTMDGRRALDQTDSPW